MIVAAKSFLEEDWHFIRLRSEPEFILLRNGLRLFWVKDRVYGLAARASSKRYCLRSPEGEEL
jgi:hypothetical protein